MAKSRKRRPRSFFHEHSLGLITAGILGAWIIAYVYSDPSTHAGSFFGNAIADWIGVFAIVVFTKYFYEIGSGESRKPKLDTENFFGLLWEEHSLSIVLVITGLVWIAAYMKSDPQGKWGQVIGNIVSEWTQILGTVLLTKRLIERGSKEGHG
jgi:hypothetical protein